MEGGRKSNGQLVGGVSWWSERGGDGAPTSLKLKMLVPDIIGCQVGGRSLTVNEAKPREDRGGGGRGGYGGGGRGGYGGGKRY